MSKVPQLKSPSFSLWKRLTNIGGRYGLPKYIVGIGLTHIAIVFIPENAYQFLGIDPSRYLASSSSRYMSYMVSNTPFPHAMLVFLHLSPIVFFLNTALSLSYFNTEAQFHQYLRRRDHRLEKNRKKKDWALITLLTGFSLLCYWATYISLREPRIFRDFVPVKNEFVLAFVHGGGGDILFPLLLTVVVLELRANFMTDRAGRPR